MDWLTWETAQTLANSNFFTSFIGALAGAYAVQRIADKTKKKETLLQELRACCHAIEMAHGVGSAHIGLKKQHVKGLKERYDEQRAHVHAIHAANVAGQLPPGAQLHVGLDCELMSAVRTRAAYLETLVLEKLSAPLRPRSLAVVLTRCTEQLNDAIGQRNEVVQRLPTMPMEERFARVFGLRLPEGFDNQYRDMSMPSTSTQTTASILVG